MKAALILMATIVALSAGSVMAEEGQVSKNTLAKMGLPGMKVMSDSQGMAIRGRFFVASSTSVSSILNSSSTNSFTVVGFGTPNNGATVTTTSQTTLNFNNNFFIQATSTGFAQAFGF